MTAAVERGMRLASVEFARDCIQELAKTGVLTCTFEQALGLFDFDSVSIVSSRSKASKKRESKKSQGGGEKKSSKPKITPKPTVLLPFCGVVMEDWCAGVKFNHGLHTQCTQGRCNGDRYCKTCRKHADNSATGKPPYGDIADRANYGVDYRDPKGKLTMPYANVADKLGINMDAANAAAATLTWTIPAEQLVKRVSKRGRPAKSAAVSDTDSDSDGESKTTTKGKKKRGRPTKPKAKPATQEDQIAQLVAEAYAETATVAPKKVVKKVKKAKKPKMTAEEKEAAKLAKQQEKEAAKLAKKEAAEKLKAEKEAEKVVAKLAKKEAAEKLKAEKKAAKEAEKLVKQQEKEAAKLAKKEAADKLKAEKLAAKKLEQEQKAAAKATAKAKKLAAAKAKALAKKKSKTAQLKVPVAEVKAVEQEDLFLGTDDVEAAQASVVAENAELDFEAIDEAADSSDDEDEGIELSETMTVGGVEYFFSEQDGQTILFSKSGEPVGIYDADTDTVQECEFADE